MTERTSDMADGTISSGPEGASGGPQGGVAIAERPVSPQLTKEKVVISNALLPLEKRLEVAKGLLGVDQFTPEQEKAISDAHMEAAGETGKDDSGAGVYNYTPDQLSRKVDRLRRAGFDIKQRRTLIETGIVGFLPPARFIDFNPEDYVGDRRLHDLAEHIWTTGDEGRADEDFFDRTAANIRRLIDRGLVDQTQAQMLLANVQNWRNIATGPGGTTGPTPAAEPARTALPPGAEPAQVIGEGPDLPVASPPRRSNRRATPPDPTGESLPAESEAIDPRPATQGGIGSRLGGFARGAGRWWRGESGFDVTEVGRKNTTGSEKKEKPATTPPVTPEPAPRRAVPARKLDTFVNTDEFDHRRMDEYTQRVRGDYREYIDPATNRVVARFVDPEKRGRRRELRGTGIGVTTEFDIQKLGEYERRVSEVGEKGNKKKFVTLIDRRTGKEVARVEEAQLKQADKLREETEKEEEERWKWVKETEIAEGDLETEASPERGRHITEEIQRLDAKRITEGLTVDEIKELDLLYDQQKVHMAAVRIILTKGRTLPPREISDTPPKPYPDVNPRALEYADGHAYTSAVQWFRRFTKTEDRNIGPVLGYPGGIELEIFHNEINSYFEEAKRIHLLDGLDKVIAQAYVRQVIPGIKRGLSASTIMRGDGRRTLGVEAEIQDVIRYVNERLLHLGRTDPGAHNLEGVAELYWQLAKGRMLDAIDKGDTEELHQKAYLEHEFRLHQGYEDVAEETYWRTTQGYYVEVYAETEEEFKIAADSYVSRLKNITAAPQKLFQEVEQFIAILYKSDGAKKMSGEFLNKLVMSMEARLGVFGADHANELYHADSYKQFMDYINKDGKGPQRWLELLGLYDGRVAASLWMLDKDPRWEMLFALHGYRGQLAEYSTAQKSRSAPYSLYHQLREIFVEELMGISIKNSDNIEEGTLVLSGKTDKEFADLYSGLYDGKPPDGRHHGDANIALANDPRWKDKPLKEISDAETRKAVRMGRIQERLNHIKEQVEKGTQGKKYDEKKKEWVDYDIMKDHLWDLLPEEVDGKVTGLDDKKFFQQELKKAEQAFEIAFEMYGALGEVSKRNGGVVMSDWKVGPDGKRHRDYITAHKAEKYIQFIDTWTSIKYAKASEKVRNAKRLEARERGLRDLKEKGLDALPTDEDGNQMTIRRPKVDANGKVMKIIVNGKERVATEEVKVNFRMATTHIYGDWTSHSYLGYQEENRHGVLSAQALAQAREIIEGTRRPEEADMWAIQRLIMDPTLNRIRLPGIHNEARERQLAMAAVERSNNTHWEITKEIYRTFFPEYVTPTDKNLVYYGLQDYGGFRKMVEQQRARAGEDPGRFARRGPRLIPELHNPIAAVSEMWGVGTSGAMGAMRMLAVPIHRGAGTFALDKIAAQADYANKIYNSLFGYKDENGEYHEGVLLKPTNESDTELQQYWLKLPEVWDDPAQQQEFCVSVRKSFNRLEKYLKLLTMESTVRNAEGALDLSGVDIILGNGQLNPIIEDELRSMDVPNENSSREALAKFVLQMEELSKLSDEELDEKYNRAIEDDKFLSANTGTGRHNAKAFFDKFIDFMMDDAVRGGLYFYPGEKDMYLRMNDKIIVSKKTYRRGKVVVSYEETSQTIRDWLFGKMVPV